MSNNDRRFIVCRSSAGSGKTYNLVRQYLLLALESPEVDRYTRILAITFTNNAASEMKERILVRLHDFSLYPSIPTSQGAELFGWLVEKLNVSPTELQTRAQGVLSHVLHHYNRFSVGTIDSFIHRVVRSFARDLNVHPDFDIRLEKDDLWEEVLDRCLDEVGINESLTRHLISLVESQMDDGAGWNPRNVLSKFVTALESEEGKKAIAKQQALTWDDFKVIHLELKSKIKELEKEACALAGAARDLLYSWSRDPSDFKFGKNGPLNRLVKLADVVDFSTDNPYWEKELKGNLAKVIEGGWASPKSKGGLSPIEPQINQAIHDLHAWHQSDRPKKLFVLSKLSQQYFSLVLTHHLESIAKQIKKDRNFLLISDFHNLVSEVVQQSQAPYIYEKVGERYSDILFDEFQDTSGLQWSNFLPLVHNSLAADGTVFIVGDGKQSIYRWRNGKVEQFIELPHVPETDATANINVLTHSLLEKVTLKDNWRSAKKIVEFNNAFFDQLKGHYPQINDVYEEQEQHAKGNTEGYISWQACMGEEGEKEVLDGIVGAIKESVQDGFSYADITLITRKGGKESGPIAAHLKQHGIKVSTKDSFLLSLSPRVNLIMSYLFFLAMPKDEFYRFDFVRNLQQVFPELFSEEGWDQWIMEYTRLKDQQVGHCFLNLAEFKQKVASLFPRLPLTWSTGSSAFDVTRRAIEIWELPCDEYVEYLLDQLTSKNQQWGYSPSELIQWWLKAKQKLCIQQGENQDAVTIQTIHKTKGLEFPVVIYPRFQSKSPSQPLWVNVEKEGLGIHDALLNYTVGEPKVFHPDEFVHEYKMSVLDEVNLMYVAMTRPVDRLYILHEEKKENNKESSPKSSLYSISGRMMQEVLEKLGGESEGEKVKYGERSGPSARKNDQKIEVEHRQETRLKQTAIRLRLRELKRRKLNRFIPSQLKGEAIHQAMEEWLTGKHETEIWEAIEQEYGKLEGGLNWKNWQEEWRKTIALDQWQAFLDHKEKLFIEQPILDERGNEWRPDIFWIGEESIQLVDIKTGVAEEKHVDQIQNYARILEKVWNKPVSMNLVYTLTCQWQKLN